MRYRNALTKEALAGLALSLSLFTACNGGGSSKSADTPPKQNGSENILVKDEDVRELEASNIAAKNSPTGFDAKNSMLVIRPLNIYTSEYATPFEIQVHYYQQSITNPSERCDTLVGYRETEKFEKEQNVQPKRKQIAMPMAMIEDAKGYCHAGNLNDLVSGIKIHIESDNITPFNTVIGSQDLAFYNDFNASKAAFRLTEKFQKIRIQGKSVTVQSVDMRPGLTSSPAVSTHNEERAGAIFDFEIGVVESQWIHPSKSPPWVYFYAPFNKGSGILWTEP